MFGHLDKHVVCFVMISVGCNERWLVGYGTVSINQFRVTYYFILNIFYIITNKWAYVTWARVVICTMQLLHALLLHPANRHMWMKNKKKCHSDCFCSFFMHVVQFVFASPPSDHRNATAQQQFTIAFFFVYSRIKWYIMQFIYFETISTARWWNVEKNTVHWEGKSLQVRWAKCDCCWWMNKSVLSAAILFGLTFFRICHTRKYRIFLMNTHKAINVRGILSIVLWTASAVL